MVGRVAQKLMIPEGQEKAALVDGLREQFGDRSFKEMMENLLAHYPGNPVRKGESWERNSLVSSGIPLVLHNTWALNGIKDGRLSLAVRSVGKPRLSDANGNASNLCYDVAGMQEGTMELDAGSGWIKSGTFRQQLSGRVIVEGSQQLGQSISWPISVESTTTFSPIEGLPEVSG